MQRTLVLLALSACTTSSPEELPDALTPPSPDAAMVTTPIQGTVEDWSSTPIAGATACVMGRPDIACGSTDVTGKYTLQMPSIEGNIAFEITAPDHLGFIDLENERNGFLVYQSGIPLRSTANATAFLAQAGLDVSLARQGVPGAQGRWRSRGRDRDDLGRAGSDLSRRERRLWIPRSPRPRRVARSCSATSRRGWSMSPCATEARSAPWNGGGEPIAGDWAPTSNLATAGAVIAAETITSGIHVACGEPNESH